MTDSRVILRVGVATEKAQRARNEDSVSVADGLYLVRIEGGRMVSALPSSGPGVMLRSNGAARIAGDATDGGRR